MTANLQSNKEGGSHRPRSGQRRLGQSRFEGTRNAQLLASDTESPPLSPARAERRPLRVEFALMEDDEKSSGGEDRELTSFRNGAHRRFIQPRLSLLGRPLNYRQHRRDVRYRRLQARIYNFLERPKEWTAWVYHFSVFAVVLLCLVLSVLASIKDFEAILSPICEYMEVVLLVWIAMEFCLRLWSSGCRSRYQGCMGRLKFMRRPLCLIDVILLLASLVSLIVGSTQDMFATSSLRGFRFFQILRLVRMDRRGGTWKLLGSVVWAHRQELLTTLYIGVLGLIFSSFFVYLAEKDAHKGLLGKEGSEKRFSSFADALWWGVVTLCTVGYGDVVPTTWGGKLIASFSAILGISFFALPAGILGSGFALKVQQQQRQKHLNRRRVPAAQLIQCLWRCYAADENSMSLATWKPHMVPCPSPTLERPWKNNASFVSRFSTRRRERSGTNSTSRENSSGERGGIQSPMTPRQNSKKMHHSNTEEDVPDALNSLVNRTCLLYTTRSHLSLATGIAEQRTLDHLPVKKENSISSICKDSEDEPDLSPRVQQLTDVHKRAIRSIRKMKYYVARRKFREALRPYDVKDVIEQYSAGHIDMLGRIKNLQARLDQILGKVGSKNKDVYDSKQSLASRVVKVERSTEDIEAKLDLLVDMYKEDRRILLQYLQTQMSSQTQPTPANQTKPRPILVEKQFTSEPATPTSLSHNPVKPMQRNLSDLSQRIKKRVTYRCLSLNDPPPRLKNCTKNVMTPFATSEDMVPSQNPPVQSGLVIGCKGDNSCEKGNNYLDNDDDSDEQGEEYYEKEESLNGKEDTTPLETDPLLGESRDSKDNVSETIPVTNLSEPQGLKSGSNSTFSSDIDAVFSSPDDDNISQNFDVKSSVNEGYVSTEINENTLDFHIQCETSPSKYNHC
ncbi:potassium voltage-gated channel subfamily KQT member 1-like [Haliotis rufescens]|uniref:potassium voltage-gated channel subfamily KQT member 1-like n=1 Tax=Haliotis rufescens TaxID=6454 RepID=UPI001EB01CBC|nr:potassium voltage-gated channel subfamily KQT member 1-like [Haliotis rufescens]